MGLIQQDPVTDNKLLQIINGIEAKLKPEDQQAYTQIVVAGLKVMFDPATHDLMVKSLHTSDNTAQAVATSISTLITGLYRESKNTMPIKSAIPAAVVLMCHELEYMEKTMGLQADADMIAQATQATVQLVLARFGISQQRVTEAMQQAKTLQPQMGA